MLALLHSLLLSATATCLLVQVEETQSQFRTVVKAGGLMDVVESYPWDGSERLYRRRDKRRGVHTGRVTRDAEGPTIQYVCSFWPNNVF